MLGQEPVSAAVTVAGSSMKGQWPLRSSTRISGAREGGALALGMSDGNVGVPSAPEHERGSVERAQRPGEPFAVAGHVGDGAVELEDGATGGAVESSYMRSTYGRGSPAGCRGEAGGESRGAWSWP